MEDIVPSLLKDIKNTFAQNLRNNPEVKQLYGRIYNGSADYAIAEEYAYEIGKALSEALRAHITTDTLPDGRMYFNIADRILAPLLEQNHEMLSDAAVTVQKFLNEQVRIGLAARRVDLMTDRIKGIIDKVSDALSFDDVSWLLGDPIINYSQAVVDQTLKANVEFQGKAGLRPMVNRTAESRCCAWCRSLAGQYVYPDLPEDVFRRHENCRCTVTFRPGDGRRQDVWSKQWG